MNSNNIHIISMQENGLWFMELLSPRVQPNVERKFLPLQVSLIWKIILN